MKNLLPKIIYSLILMLVSGCVATTQEIKKTALPPATAEAIIENAQIGNLENVRSIIDRVPTLIHVTNNKGYTPLHLAACPGFNGDYRIAMDYAGTVALLLDRGADVNSLGENNMTPLHMVVAYRKPSGSWSVKINGLPYEQHLKAMQLRSLRTILSYNPNINAATKQGHSTPLHLAAYMGHVEMVRLLLQADADPNVVTENGKTPLDYAKESKHYDVITVLEGLK